MYNIMQLNRIIKEEYYSNEVKQIRIFKKGQMSNDMSSKVLNRDLIKLDWVSLVNNKDVKLISIT